MENSEIKQIKKDFAGHIEGIEQSRCEKIKSKDVNRLAKDFVLERFGLAPVVKSLVRDFYRHHTFAPETKTIHTEAMTRLCEIAAGLEEIGQMRLRISALVQNAIKEGGEA